MTNIYTLVLDNTLMYLPLRTYPLSLLPPPPKVRDTDCIDIYLYTNVFFILLEVPLVLWEGLLSILFSAWKYQLKKRKKKRVKEERKEKLRFQIFHYLKWATYLKASGLSAINPRCFTCQLLFTRLSPLNYSIKLKVT